MYHWCVSSFFYCFRLTNKCQLFRFINIAFTTAALAISIRIRTTELKNNALGAVGSSPYVVSTAFTCNTLHERFTRMVVIIFAPPTLVHVLMAVYVSLLTTSGKYSYISHLAGIFWTSSRPMAYIRETCSHTI